MRLLSQVSPHIITHGDRAPKQAVCSDFINSEDKEQNTKTTFEGVWISDIQGFWVNDEHREIEVQGCMED